MMITVETMRRIAPKQGCALTHKILEFTADVLERDTVEHTINFLEMGKQRGRDAYERRIFAQLLQIMRSPEVIDEWTQFGEGEA